MGFKITETTAITNLTTARMLAQPLRASGCRITLDDVGTGFGSLVHLKQQPITGSPRASKRTHGLSLHTSASAAANPRQGCTSGSLCAEGARQGGGSERLAVAQGVWRWCAASGGDAGSPEASKSVFAIGGSFPVL